MWTARRRAMRRRCREPLLNALNRSPALLMPHLMLAPIALPMFTAALMLLLRAKSSSAAEFGVSLVSTLVGLLVSIACCNGCTARRRGGHGRVPAGQLAGPFGIVLVLDRLAALMLLLTSLVALCSMLFAGALAPRRRALPALFQFS